MHFDNAVAQVRAGTRAPDHLAREIADELTDDELLGLLDGDSSFLDGVRRIGRDGYNHEPIVAGNVERLGIPGIRFTDGPRGIVMGNSTCFPVAMARGATWDVDLEREIGDAIGREGRAQGANLFAGVCVNVLRHPGWGRAQETYGDDPVHLGAMGSALTRGVRHHLMACVKHFALNSIEENRFEVDVTVDDAVLHECFLPQFRTVVEAGADAVMSAYNSVNGEWCGDSTTLLSDILRDEWGFDGIVMSDFVFGLRDPVGSVQAGLDIEMPFRQQRAAALPDALSDGTLRRPVAVEAARRIITTQLRWAARTTPSAPDAVVVASPAHRSLARRAAAQSMVLLENRTFGSTPLLPLDAPTTGRLAVIGALADADNLGDEGSSAVRPPSAVRIVDGLRSAFSSGGCEYDAGSDIEAAVVLARTSDVAVVVVGYTAADEGESLIAMDRDAMSLLPGVVGSRRVIGAASKVVGLASKFRGASGGDRRSLTLSEHDETLVAAVTAANPRTIVVLVAGSAVLTEAWRHDVGALLLAWYPGMEGGAALADVLTGATEPGGRLPFAIPTHEAHLPHFDPDASSIEYDQWWGQRRFDRDQRNVAFPLGAGSGYTTFEASDLSITTLDAEKLAASVEVTVTNTGQRAGATIIQVYGTAGAGRQRPHRQLLGFRRVELDPGATTDATIDITLRPLAQRDSVTRQWAIVGANHTVEAGQFSDDPHAAVTLLPLPLT